MKNKLHIGFWYIFKWNINHPFIQLIDGDYYYTAAVKPPKGSYIGFILGK